MKARDEQLREVEALQSIIKVLTELPIEAQKRLLTSASVFLDIDTGSSRVESTSNSGDDQTQRYTFSGRGDQTPKDFLYEKRPETDVDRAACLAYYLTHFRDMPHFKTTDISKLNTEAAQPKLSNAAYAVNNATQRGFLTPAGKNLKQLTVIGEQYVAALPDRAAARSAAEAASPRKKRPKNQKATAKKTNKD